MKVNCELVCTDGHLTVDGAELGSLVLSGHSIAESLRRGGNIIENVTWFGASKWLSTKCSPYNMYYPITCSCGDYGCAGIHKPVSCRVRKHTVEWRVPKGGGYGRLSGKFMSFDRLKYVQVMGQFLHEDAQPRDEEDDYYEDYEEVLGD